MSTISLARFRHAFWVSMFIGVFAVLHGTMPYFFDGDTGYHLAVARLTAEHGILQAFPWTPFSWMAENYADKEPIFHWLMVPIAGLEPGLAAAIAGTAFGALILATLYFLLVKEGVPAAGLWAFLALVASSGFIYRIALVRPHLLSISLALLISWGAVRRQRVLLVVACFLFPLCYTAWHLPIVLIGIVEVVRRLSGHKFEWRNSFFALAALAAGIIIHPNFPDNLELFWIQNVTVLVGTVWAERIGFDMGREFEPFNLASLILYVLIPALMLLGASILAWRKRNEDLLPVALSAIALGFFVITLRTQRFIEYLVPFTVFALAVAWRPPVGGRASRFPVVGIYVVICAAWIAFVARYPLDLLRTRIEAFPPTVAAQLRNIVAENEQVVTCDWGFTGEMMLALPGRRFMVALDPVFFAMKDEALYRVWFDTIHNPPRDAADRLRRSFDARYVLCQNSPQWKPLLKSLDADPAATFLGRHGIWVVFELMPPVARG